jgi:hypothetical protein
MGTTVIALVLLFFFVSETYAILKQAVNPDVDVTLATWNVTLNQTGVNDDLTIIPELLNASYTLNITSQSQTDIKYSIIISGLPTGVEISLDGGSYQSQQSNHTISFANVGTILISDAVKTKTHTLTFRAVTGATVVTEQDVDIDVVVKQLIT